MGRRLPQLALALGLLAGPAQVWAQAPTLVYATGLTTQALPANVLGPNPIAANTPLIAQINPTTQSYVTNSAVVVTGLTPGQQIVGIDGRPATGQLYALGYNNTTQAARLYLLDPTTGVATPVPGSSEITLNLVDANRANTRGFIPTVGFDFNPRLDRIRVVAPNGTNYRLNPNNGALVATDGTLTYAASSLVTPGRVPYIGTAAYTNSALGVMGTTLYDIDVANTNALLSIQAPPNAGTLNGVAPVTFQTNGDPAFYPLTSPTIGLDLDIFYDRTNKNNLAYLIEARYSDSKNTDINNGSFYNQLATNFWALDLATGKAVGRNIVGQVPGFFSNIAVMPVMPKTWTGLVSTDWGNGSNWYPVGVPTSTDDVVIPGSGSFVAIANVTVSNQPVVSNTQQAASVNLVNGAVLTTADGGVLNVSGDFVNNDSQVAGSGTGTVALVGGSPQDIGGNMATRFQNLRVGTGTTASTSADVSIGRSVMASGSLAIGAGQSFTLLSDANGTAYAVNNGSGLITGTATVQRYITPTNPGPGYRHYSTPVSGNTVADFATASYSPVVNPAYNSSNTPRQVSPYPTVFYYDQSRLATSNASYAVGDFDNGFLSPGDLTDALTIGQGYTVNIGGSELVDFQGTLNQASSYARTGLVRGAQASAGYQLLGNPYPGAISYDALIASSTGMESALYVYKSTGQYAGTYTTYVPGGPTNGGPGVSANGGTSNIPLSQGFFMRTAVGQTGSVTFTAAARTNAPETAKFERTAADSRPTLALTLRNASLANQTRVYFDEHATPAFDAQYDAHYLPATHGLDLASDISTEALAINALPALASAVTVPLRLHAPAAGAYTLAVDELANLPAGFRAYLRDATAGTYTDLTTTPSVSLTLSATDPATGRYALVFSANAPLATASAALSAQAGLYPSPAHGTATLVLPLALRGSSASTVQVLNTLGQVVLTKTLAAGAAPNVELPLSGLATGIYTVRATTAAGLIAKRLVVQ